MCPLLATDCHISSLAEGPYLQGLQALSIAGNPFPQLPGSIIGAYGLRGLSISLPRGKDKLREAWPDVEVRSATN
jgi:hypothetical protein